MNASHAITHATWIGDGTLLAATTLHHDPAADAACLRRDGETAAAVATHPLPAGSAWIVRTGEIAKSDSLRFQAGGKTITVRIGELPLGDMKSLARDCFAALGACERDEVLQFLASASPAQGRVTRNLVIARELLRERLAESIVAPESAQALHVEELLALDGSAFFIRGWFSDADAPATRLRVFSPEGSQADLLDATHRHARPDIARLYGLPADTTKFGFMATFAMRAPATLSRGWHVELHATGAESLEAAVPPAIADPEHIRTTLLHLLPAHGCGELLEKHIHPALTRLAARERADVEIASIEQFGTPPANPAVSILITLECGGELIEHQLAQFANDPAVRAADILFFLRNPAHAEPLASLAARLCLCYDVPFRLAVPTIPLSPALARNAAAAIALAPRLVFLASSVFPDRPGWLAPLLAANPAGAAGAKLLREDDTIAHAGIELARSGGTWSPRSRYRGLQRHFPQACIAADAPSLSGACFAISRERFDSLGGFSPSYATPQLDDADFFLRLAAIGATSRYVPDAELYHLPILKKTPALSSGAALYDAWLFARTHSEDAH